MEEENVTAFHLTGGLEGETADAMYIVFNPNKEAKEITLPEGEWHVCINGEDAGNVSLEKVSGTATVDAISPLVLVQGEVAADNGSGNGMSTGTTVALSAAVLAALSGAVIVRKKGSKK